MDDHIFMDSNNPIWDKQGEIDWRELYKELYDEVYNLGCFVDDIRQESNNGLIILIGNKLNEIINNQ